MENDIRLKIKLEKIKKYFEYKIKNLFNTDNNNDNNKIDENEIIKYRIAEIIMALKPIVFVNFDKFRINNNFELFDLLSLNINTLKNILYEYIKQIEGELKNE